MQIIPAASLAVESAQPAAPRLEGLYQDRSGGGRTFERIMEASASRLKLRENAPEVGGLPKKTERKTDFNCLVAFSGVAFQSLAMPEAIDASDEQTLNQCIQVINSIVDILEGDAPDKDMVNLLQRLDTLLGELKTPVEQNVSELAREIMARMPQIDAIKKGDITAVLETDENAELNHPCPLENDNEQITELSSLPRDPSTRADRLKWDETELIRTAPIIEEPGPVVAPPAELDATGSGQVQHIAQRSGPQQQSGNQADGDESAQSEDDTLPQGAQLAAAGATTLDIAPFRAEAGLAAEQANATQATRETLLDTMVEQMTLSSAEGASTVEIELRPDFLGKVSIELSLDQHGLQAKIRADDPGVKSLIGGQINQLIEALNQKGVRVNELEVVYTGPQTQSFEQGGREAPAGQSRQGRSQNRGREAKIEASAFDSAVPASQILPDSATVEYRA